MQCLSNLGSLQGLPSNSMQWGAWAGVGMAASNAMRLHLERVGMGAVQPVAGLAALGAVLGRLSAAGTVMNGMWHPTVSRGVANLSLVLWQWPSVGMELLLHNSRLLWYTESFLLCRVCSSSSQCCSSADVGATAGRRAPGLATLCRIRTASTGPAQFACTSNSGITYRAASCACNYNQPYSRYISLAFFVL